MAADFAADIFEKDGLRLPEGVTYGNSPHGVPRGEVFRKQECTATFFCCHDDERIPERIPMALVEVYCAQNRGPVYCYHVPVQQVAHDGPGRARLHGFRKFPGHRYEEFLQHLSADNTEPRTPQVGKDLSGLLVLDPCGRIVSVDQDICVDEYPIAAHRSHLSGREPYPWCRGQSQIQVN